MTRLPLPDPPLTDGPVTLGPWTDEDAPALVEAWADEAMQRWNPVPENRGLAAARLWISNESSRRRRGQSLDLVIRSDGRVAGEVGLRDVDTVRRAVLIGWWLLPDARGGGLGTIAVRLLTQWAHRELDLESVVAQIHADNIASLRLAERCGYTLLGTGRAGRPDAYVARRSG